MKRYWLLRSFVLLRLSREHDNDNAALVRRGIEGYGEEVMRGWKLSWDRRQQLKGMLAVYLV